MAHQSFNDIYLGMQDRIYRLSAGIVGNRADAEDIVQDLYEKLWRKRLWIMARHNPGGYILTSARNLCLDRLRIRKTSIELSPAVPSGDDRYDESDIGEVVRRLMASLPEKQRTVIHLRDIECMDIDEIAAIMETGESAVRMSLSRARATLKEQLVKTMNHGI
jgi:RNA polymerase sigma-70 factor (ECF subfamily)